MSHRWLRFEHRRRQRRDGSPGGTAPERRRGGGLFWCFLVLLALGPGPGWVDPQASRADEIVIADFRAAETVPPDPWKLEVHEGEPDIFYVEEESGQALCLRSDAAASYGIQRHVGIELDRTPILVWSWKVTEIPQHGHFVDASRDDQAAQLVVAFESGFLGRRRVISYIWGSTASQGTTGETITGEEIPLLDMKAVVVESGAEKTDQWQTETRNVAQDYRRLFQEPPTDPVGIRIQINSQHTDARAESCWRTIRFTDEPPAGPTASP